MSKEIEETTQARPEDDQIASILEHLPIETEIHITVPSGGKIYFGGKEGPVTIRPIKFGDEKDIATAGRGPEFNAANFLLEKCVLNVDAQDLLIIDKLYLLLKIREISYGNDYKVTVICNHCFSENKLNLEIDKLAVEPVPEDFDLFDIEVDLKGIKKKARVSAPQVSEERYLYSKNAQTDLWRFVNSIDGNNTKGIIAKVIPQLPIADVHRIINALALSDYGVQPQIKYSCDTCEKQSVVTLPIDENFFSVS